jgi:hypothetical protein
MAQTTVKDLEQQVIILTQTVDKLTQSITTFNNTGNRKLDEALKVKSVNFDIEQVIKDSLLKAIKDSMTALFSYSERDKIQPIIINALNSNKEFISNSINEGIKQAFNELEVEALVKEQVKSKVARSLLSGIDSLIDSSINELRKDVRFNSQLVLAIDKFIKEYNK